MIVDALSHKNLRVYIWSASLITSVDHLELQVKGASLVSQSARCPVLPDARDIHGPGIISAPSQPMNISVGIEEVKVYLIYNIL